VTEPTTMDREPETGPPGPLTFEVVAQLAEQVRLRLGGRIRDFRLTIREMGLVMEGRIRLHGRPLEPDRASTLYFRHEADVYWSPQLRKIPPPGPQSRPRLSREPTAQGAQRRQSIASHSSSYSADWQRENRATVSGSLKGGWYLHGKHS
jgi:hypothetical protein